jgi:hypothetical protein
MSLPTAVELQIARGSFPDAGSFFMALYTTILNVTTAINYSPTGEVAPSGNYDTKGFAMAAGAFSTDFWGQSAATAVFDAADTQSPVSSTFTFRSLLVYNDTPTTPIADPGLYFFDAGSNQVVSNGQLTVIWPTPDSVTGLVRVPQ